MRMKATQIKTVAISADGSSSDESNSLLAHSEAMLRSHNRPHTYFFTLMDCDHNLQRVYNKGTLPRMATELVIVDSITGVEEDGTHFSYEDQGLLSLHCYMMLAMSCIFALMLKEFSNYYREE